MNICLVAGNEKVIKVLKTQIEKMPNLNGKVTLAYRFIKDLTKEVIERGVTALSTVDAVVIVDKGFSYNEAEKRQEELLELQDTLNVKRFTKKVYIITKDSELYKTMGREENKDSNFVYRNTKLFIYEGNLKVVYLRDVLLGKLDGADVGEAHKDFGIVKDLYDVDEMERSLNGVDEYGRRGNEGYNRFTGENVSNVGGNEYLGSSNFNKVVKERERDERRQEREKRKRDKKSAEKDERESLITPDHVFVNSGDITQYRVKIMADRGVLFVTGVEGSGTSGVVSNIAQMYDKVDSKVAVIDLDIYKSYQSIYFKEYNESSRESNGLVNLVKNYKSNIVEGVNVEGGIDVFSIRRDEVVNNDFEKELITKLSLILSKLRDNYDVVVVDIPLHYLGLIDIETAKEVNAVLYLTENHTYKLEDLFILNLRKLMAVNQGVMAELFEKSYIAYNKYVEGRYGFTEGEKCDSELIKELIDNLPRPYSKVIYTTHIPFDVKWEHQIIEGNRWINSGDSAENEITVTSLLGQIVFKNEF